MYFGLHRLIPGSSSYITFLRNPVERVHSFYYYARSNPDHYLYNALTAERLDLEAMLAQDASLELCNEQTRMLTGDEWEDPQRPVTHAALKRAMANLQTHFRVVGLTEEFDASVLLLHKMFGWQLACYGKENVTKNKPDSAFLDAETRSLIEETNIFDLKLYEYARELFNEQRHAAGLTESSVAPESHHIASLPLLHCP